MLVTRKKSNKSAKFETIEAFLPPSLEHVKGILSKCKVLKVDLLQDRQVYCLEEIMWALFSLEILQAWAVKGLNYEPVLKILQNIHTYLNMCLIKKNQFWCCVFFLTRNTF